jgi:hypothetical protein
MRKVDILLGGAVVLFTLAGVRWTLANPGRSANPQDGAALLKTENLLKREYSEARPLDGKEGRAGRIVFLPEPEARFLGLAAAHMCPHQGDGPSFAAAQNVVAMQAEDGLVLEPWVRLRRPEEQGAHWYVCFALWLETPSGREWRTGWAQVALKDLIATGLAVSPKRNESIDVRVAAADGTAVPGAMISIDDARYPVGRFFQYAFTGEDGTVRVSGLDPDRRWTIALPEGVGPDRAPDSKTISVPTSAPVVLSSPLEGAWVFQRHFVRPPMRGASVRVTGLFRTDRPSLAPVWSVAPWLGPGRGPWCPLYLMHPRELQSPERVSIRFEGADPVEVDISREARIVCQRAEAKR